MINNENIKVLVNDILDDYLIYREYKILSENRLMVENVLKEALLLFAEHIGCDIEKDVDKIKIILEDKNLTSYLINYINQWVLMVNSKYTEDNINSLISDLGYNIESLVKKEGKWKGNTNLTEKHDEIQWE